MAQTQEMRKMKRMLKNIEYDKLFKEKNNTIWALQKVIAHMSMSDENEDNLWCDVRDIFINNPDALQTLPKCFLIKRKPTT